MAVRETYISKTLSALVDGVARVDEKIKALLADKQILARILKYSVEEFKEYDILDGSLTVTFKKIGRRPHKTCIFYVNFFCFIYRALDVLGNECDMIQSDIYKNSHFLGSRNDKILYYDCTNYYFESEQEDGSKKYGKSK